MPAVEVTAHRFYQDGVRGDTPQSAGFPALELWLNARVVLLLDVARFRAAARVLCRLDAGEQLLLDGAVGRSWTSRFSIPTGAVRSLLMCSKSETLKTPPVSSVQECQAPLKEIEGSPPARLSRS